jgi:hypothetical protein
VRDRRDVPSRRVGGEVAICAAGDALGSAVAMEQQSALAEICALASSRAEDRGHELGAWVEPSDDDGLARRATCRRCGRVVYVRVEEPMRGMAGAALTEVCGPDGARPA